MQATNARHYEEKDARLEYLSWRVWFMKRNRARVKREDAATLAAEQVRTGSGQQVSLNSPCDVSGIPASPCRQAEGCSGAFAASQAGK